MHNILQASVGKVKKLEDEEWFHGVLPREEVQRLLEKDGDFLVRESKNKRTNDTQYVLSAYWQGYRHFIIQFTDVSVSMATVTRCLATVTEWPY